MAEQNYNSFLKIGLVVVIIFIVGLVFIGTRSSSTTQSTTMPYTSSVQPSTTNSTTSVSQIAAGCPNINYIINNTAPETSGFLTYAISGGHADLVLSKSSQGTVTYTSTVRQLAGQPTNILNTSQLVIWANSYQYPVSNGILGSAMNSMISGMTVSFAISTKNFSNSTRYNITASVYATPIAKLGTYYITLGPGLPFCGAQMQLITIGNNPYNGTFPIANAT